MKSHRIAPILCLVAVGSWAFAQVESSQAVDEGPEANASASPSSDAPAPEANEAEPDNEQPKEQAQPPPAPAPSAKAIPTPPVIGNAQAPSPPPSALGGPKPLKVLVYRDGDLESAWKKWLLANGSLDRKAEAAAQAELLELKEDLGISDLEAFSVGFSRAALRRIKSNDSAGAVALDQAAVALAPHLPYAHLQLAYALFNAEPLGVSRYGGEVKAALANLVREPRYARPLLGDVGTGALFALVATACAVLVTLMVRRSTYFFHDFHHLFPKAAARWQSATLASLVLAMPLVFHLGLLPILLTLFAAVVLYLTVAERLVAAALLVAVGALPIAAGILTEKTAFPGTPAEEVAMLEEGGLKSTESAARIGRRVGEDKADFPEIFALARYELRRGQIEAAIAHFKLAAAKRANEARLLTNLGNAMVAKGDPDGALEIYKTATQADPSLAAAFYNLAKVYNRRAAGLPNEAVGAELDKAHVALSTAQGLDESLLYRQDPEGDSLLVNRVFLYPSLKPSEIAALADSSDRGDRVATQLSIPLLGPIERPWCWYYPPVLTLLLFGVGFLRRRIRASRPCQKCGRAVCRRCDPEIGIASQLCGQCVNVFARKEVVPAPIKVRKQVEVARRKVRNGRISYALGMICSGTGHIFAGLPLRGTIYAFIFLFAAFNLFYRQGILRPPYGSAPALLREIPFGLLLIGAYLLSLRGLYRSAEE